MFFCTCLDKNLIPNIEGYSDFGAYSTKEDFSTGPFMKSILELNQGFQWVESQNTNIVSMSFMASKANSTYQTNATLRPASISVLVLLRL